MTKPLPKEELLDFLRDAQQSLNELDEAYFAYMTCGTSVITVDATGKVRVSEIRIRDT